MPRWSQILLANLLATLALLLGLEGLSRLMAPTPSPQPLIAEDQEDWLSERRFHPLLFWQPTPRMGRDGKVVINELGLRGPLPGPKGSDEYRILSLGESTTAAMRLPFEASYSSVLERELGSLDGRRVRVVNAGVGGYTVAQGFTLLELHGAALEPDLVLTYFGHNDFIRVAFRAERNALADEGSLGWTDRQLLERRRRPWSRAASWLLAHSNFARWLRSDEVELTVRQGRRRRVPAADRRHYYEAIAAWCAAREVRLVALVPVYRRFTRHETLLRELGAEGAIEVLDLPRALGPLSADLFFDPVHPRAEVHRRIGRAIADYLRAPAR